TARKSILGLRKRGRHVQVGLMVGGDATSPIPMNTVMARELELVGSHGLAARDYPKMLDRIASGELNPRRLVGRTIGLDEAPAALMAMDGPSTGSGMTVIVPSQTGPRPNLGVPRSAFQVAATGAARSSMSGRFGSRTASGWSRWP